MPQSGVEQRYIQVVQGEPAAPLGEAHGAEGETHAAGHSEHGGNPLAEHQPAYYSSIGILVALTILILVGAWRSKGTRTRGASRGQLYLEQCVASIRHFCRGAIGEGGEKFAPLIGTMFVFILFSNLCGVLPMYLQKGEGSAVSFTPAPTANLSMNLAIALIVFVVFNYVGIKSNGLGNYIKHFAGPMPALAPLIFPIEMISALIRPITLSLRLFGNVFGEEMVIAVLIGLAATILPIWLPIPIHALMLPLAVLGSIIQAGVFCILTCSYISMAIGDHGHEEHGHEESGAAHAH